MANICYRCSAAMEDFTTFMPDIAPPSAVSPIQDRISSLDKAIEQCEIRIAALQPLLSSLKNERSVMITSPLAEVFRHCRPPQSSAIEDMRRDELLIPLTVSHVCKRWRDVAISTPFIWNVHKYPEIYGEGDTMSIDIIQNIFIPRSVPFNRLAVLLNINAPQIMGSPGVLKDVFRSSGRWKLLALDFNDLTPLAGVCMDFPSLKRLQLWALSKPAPIPAHLFDLRFHARSSPRSAALLGGD